MPAPVYDAYELRNAMKVSEPVLINGVVYFPIAPKDNKHLSSQSNKEHTSVAVIYILQFIPS